MQAQTVSPNVFKASTSNINFVFGVKETKSVDGAVVDITTLYLAKKYGEDYSVLICELVEQDDPSLYTPNNILNSPDDAIVMALNASV